MPNFTITCTRIAKVITISLCCDVTGALDLCKVALKTQMSQVLFTCHFRYFGSVFECLCSICTLLHNRAPPKHKVHWCIGKPSSKYKYCIAPKVRIEGKKYKQYKNPRGNLFLLHTS